MLYFVSNLLFFSFFSFILSVSASASATKAHPVGTNWAVLIAGSNTYYNYRHQSDISHAYQILTKMGKFPEENIITMMYNDVANSSQNPFPGQLFNEPGGVDVYEGVHIDYQMQEVTAKNFLNVLKGNQTHPKLPVLKSGPNDNVFIYYSDHGAVGLVAMPVGAPLYADDLIDALEYMFNNKMYSQLVFYLEACESGSMFNKILPNNISIYATAANPSESSYAFYYNATLGTYMADEYSIRWMQDTTNNWENIKFETLLQQFTDVRSIVNESHVQQYGDFEFTQEPIEDFEAFEDRRKNQTHLFGRSDEQKFRTNNRGINIKQTKAEKLNHMFLNISELKPNSDLNIQKQMPVPYSQDWKPSTEAVDSRDVKFAILQHRYLASKTMEEKIKYFNLLENELENRLKTDIRFFDLIELVTGYSDDKHVNSFIYGSLPNNQQINFECLKSVYQIYETECSKFNDYSLKYVRSLVNLCYVYDEEAVVIALYDICFVEKEEKELIDDVAAEIEGELEKYSEYQKYEYNYE
jgi:legumain